MKRTTAANRAAGADGRRLLDLRPASSAIFSTSKMFQRQFSVGIQRTGDFCHIFCNFLIATGHLRSMSSLRTDEWSILPATAHVCYVKAFKVGSLRLWNGRMLTPAGAGAAQDLAGLRVVEEDPERLPFPEVGRRGVVLLRHLLVRHGRAPRLAPRIDHGPVGGPPRPPRAPAAAPTPRSLFPPAAVSPPP
ncbi:hypothetical protein EVAR_80837_1 [Eumeta japonica]|uniref:Uncharacterized protein n=1 Tax=Eumeta variegata TaxID=151549 RepID=A0A4C1V013_EUMVA|nr:hypothetical protein EVAR_80837_1 [Eumeta japonica]